MTLRTTNLRVDLLDISTMDYYSKSQTDFSKSKIFRAELWRRRHTLHKNRKSHKFDIEEVFTRHMNQDNLKKLLQHQMDEAIKLMNFYSEKNEQQTSHQVSVDDIDIKEITQTQHLSITTSTLELVESTQCRLD